MICRLQGFSDASKAAYAAVVYLSIEVGTHKVNNARELIRIQSDDT